ncbi:MAG: cardiolipin synthase [Myxococcota bacterium]
MCDRLAVSGAALAATVALVVAQVVIVFGYLLVERRQPHATLAWLLAVVFVPVAGVLFYIVFGRRRMRRESVKLLRVRHRVRTRLTAPSSGDWHAAVADPREEALLQLGQKVSQSSVTIGNRCRVLQNAQTAYPEMRDAIVAARHFVHIEFYIIRDDEVGRGLRGDLVECAHRGVEVRVVYDAIGCVELSDAFFAPLVAAGGEVAVFSPVRSWQRLRRKDRVDFRNHRKIVIVDGRIGFTGGMNIGAEYFGTPDEVFRDTHIRIEGPAVLELQRVWTEDWLWASDKLVDQGKYFTVDPGSSSEEDGVVLIASSGPDRNWTPILRVYVQAIAIARERVWITNPYFIPDPVMQEALISAALRGVEVRLILPVKSDSRLVDLASRGYFSPLLAAGVHIHLYRGFVHSKTMVVDTFFSTVGSANLDSRSFHLNYELNAFVHDAGVAGLLAQHFEADLRSSDPVTREQEAAVGYLSRVFRGLARLLSPIL